MQKYLGIAEAAELTGVSRYILREEMKRGKLIGYKVGAKVLVTQEGLDTYMKSCEIQPIRKPEKQKGPAFKYVPGMKIQCDGRVIYPDGSIRYQDGHIEKPPKDGKRRIRA